MIDWKNEIDGNVATLLKKAAGCQIEMGTRDIVVCRENIVLKRSEIARRWMTATTPTAAASP